MMTKLTLWQLPEILTDGAPQTNILEDTEGDGIWTGTLKLEPGRYEYMFVLDGEKWFPDPNALRYVKDGFGNKNAILEINNCNNT